MPEVVTSSAEIAIPDGKVRLLGASTQVTGSCTLVEQGGARILVDCGMAQGRDAEPVRLEEARNVDAIVLSHGHLDHIGGLPDLFEREVRAPIWATPATLEIAKLSLEDSMGLERRDRGKIREVMAILRERVEPLGYDKRAKIGKTSMWLREAGHILGSASVELRSPSSRVIVSGDLGRPGSPLLRDPNRDWDPEQPVDLAVIETTYGGRDHDSNPKQIPVILERVLRHAIENKGKVFVPAFAIGRTQLLLYYFDQLVESGRVQDIPVVVDTPMGLTVTQTYKRYRQLYDREALDKLARGDDPLDFAQLFAVEKARDSYRVEELEGPLVILAGSGMVTGGRIVRHLQSGLDDPRNTLLFVGYQAPGTPGAAILRAHNEGRKRVRIGDREVGLAAKVEVLRGLSAHADRRELRHWLGALPELRTVLTHHGDVRAQRAFADYLAQSA